MSSVETLLSILWLAVPMKMMRPFPPTARIVMIPMYRPCGVMGYHGYWWLPVVTGGYQWLPVVTGGYQWLLVTRWVDCAGG